MKISNELKAFILDFYLHNTAKDTADKFDVPIKFVYNLAARQNVKKSAPRKSNQAFKHEVCSYYETHTGVQTCDKFNISAATLAAWRRDLGYRNKFYNYNLYTEDMKPKVAARASMNFKVSKQENGELKAELVEVKKQYQELKGKFDQLKTGLESVFESLQ